MPTHQELPEQFGRYRILKKLGAGGMGAVYLAEDSRMRRKVALKVPHFTGGTRTAGLDRFQREARLAGSIEHPNFCPVYDVDEVDSIHFFTMAYVEGTPLADLLADGQPWRAGRSPSRRRCCNPGWTLDSMRFVTRRWRRNRRNAFPTRPRSWRRWRPSSARRVVPAEQPRRCRNPIPVPFRFARRRSR